MRSSDERIALLHKLAYSYQRKRDKAILRACGSCCLMLSFILLGIFTQLSDKTPGFSDSQFTGASLLADSTGGYVLVAVLAFMLGVVVTVLVKKGIEKKKG